MPCLMFVITPAGIDTDFLLSLDTMRGIFGAGGTEFGLETIAVLRLGFSDRYFRLGIILL